MFFSTEESRIFREGRLHSRARRRSCHYCYQRLRRSSRLSNSRIRLLSYCSAITANDAFKRAKRVTFPISIFETFRGARGSLNRVPLVYHHVVWFTTANGRKGVEMGCGIEQKENEMKDRIRNREGKRKSGKEYSRHSCERTCA